MSRIALGSFGATVRLQKMRSVQFHVDTGLSPMPGYVQDGEPVEITIQAISGKALVADGQFYPLAAGAGGADFYAVLTEATD